VLTRCGSEARSGQWPASSLLGQKARGGPGDELRSEWQRQARLGRPEDGGVGTRSTGKVVHK
jgi:hypothetical protein